MLKNNAAGTLGKLWNSGCSSDQTPQIGILTCFIECDGVNAESDWGEGGVWLGGSVGQDGLDLVIGWKLEGRKGFTGEGEGC